MERNVRFLCFTMVLAVWPEKFTLDDAPEKLLFMAKVLW